MTDSVLVPRSVLEALVAEDQWDHDGKGCRGHDWSLGQPEPCPLAKLKALLDAPSDVTPWVFRVSPFPPATEEGRLWCAWVRRDGYGTWLATPHFASVPAQYLDGDGVETWDPHRFDDFDAAVRVARTAAERTTINGLTLAAATARHAAREAAKEGGTS